MPLICSDKNGFNRRLCTHVISSCLFLESLVWLPCTCYHSIYLCDPFSKNCICCRCQSSHECDPGRVLMILKTRRILSTFNFSRLPEYPQMHSINNVYYANLFTAYVNRVQHIPRCAQTYHPRSMQICLHKVSENTNDIIIR